MEKSICVDGKEVRMRASALVPRLYRFKFGRDIIKDINQLKRAYKKAESLPEDATDEEREDMQLSLMDLSIFENVAYIMAKHADPENVAGTIDEWMEQFSMFSIYGVFPQLLELWEEGTATTSLPKKKIRETIRESNGAIFMLRCAQLGLHTDDLAQMSVGMVYDMAIEKSNDAEKYPLKATQEDINRFFGG